MRTLIGLLLVTVFISLKAQEPEVRSKIVDQVVAVVGGNVILQSELEGQYLQLLAEGYRGKGNLKCQVLEDLMSQKMFLNQAKLDSIEIDDSQVESELDRRMQYFITQLGSKDKVEEYYKKSILEIKEDMYDVVRDQIIMQQMKATIVGEISISPADVKDFYKNAPKDSIPYVNSQLEVCQILRYPPFSDQSKYNVREKLLELRERIIKGESFATLAVLYSEDHGSAKKGGELGFLNRSDLVKDFADVAFTLKGQNVSKIVETEFGFHIIQLIERRDNQINVRHILMKPQVSISEKMIAKEKLDSIVELIRKKEVSFDEASLKYSDDDKTRLNGGLKVNPYTGSSKFELSQLGPAESFRARELNIEEVSDPFESTDEKGRIVYKIIKVKSKSKPHKANLEEDYVTIQYLVKAIKQQEIIESWLKDRIADTYIHVDEIYVKCNFKNSDWIK